MWDELRSGQFLSVRYHGWYHRRPISTEGPVSRGTFGPSRDTAWAMSEENVKQDTLKARGLRG
jgi:hypothetical protein